MDKANIEKRQRGPNYTQREKDSLLSIVAKHADVVENEKTNAITTKDKDIAWEKIATEFNAMAPNYISRSTDSLRKYYENQKKELRKRKAEERMEFFRTGGGPPPKSTITASDETLLSLVNNKTVNGLLNSFDADRNIEIEISSAPALKDHIIYELSKEDKSIDRERNIDNSVEVNTPTASSTVTQNHNWKRYKTSNLKEAPSAELQSSLHNVELPQTSSKNKDLRRRRPATVVRALSSSHIYSRKI